MDEQVPSLYYSDYQFLKRIRLSKHSIRYLVDLLDREIGRKYERKATISTEHKIIIVLRFYATSSFYQVVEDNIGYSIFFVVVN